MAAKGSPDIPFILGLTGPIACGKSTVGDMLLGLGARERIDADLVVHDLMRQGTEVTKRIVDEFGPGVLRPDGAVDRGALGRIVFADPAALHRLEVITHPAVRHEIRRRIRDLSGQAGVIVVDAVKLLQSDLLPLCDAVWVVQCARDEQLRRLTDLRGMTAEEALGRVAAQPSFDHRAVTTIIHNTGSRDELRNRVQGAWTQLFS